MKSGYKTTEFWLSLLALVLSWAKGHGVPELPDQAIYAVIAYALSRGLAKAGYGNGKNSSGQSIPKSA